MARTWVRSLRPTQFLTVLPLRFIQTTTATLIRAAQSAAALRLERLIGERLLTPIFTNPDFRPANKKESRSKQIMNHCTVLKHNSLDQIRHTGLNFHQHTTKRTKSLLVPSGNSAPLSIRCLTRSHIDPDPSWPRSILQCRILTGLPLQRGSHYRSSDRSHLIDLLPLHRPRCPFWRLQHRLLELLPQRRKQGGM